MPAPFLALGLIPLYVLADRMVGEGGEDRLGSLGGRSLGMIMGAGVGLGIGFLAGGWPLALMGLVWAAQRSLPWKLFGGASNPEGGRQIAGTFARHLIPAVPAVIMVLSGRFENTYLLPMAMTTYAMGATGLAILYARQIATLRKFEEPETDEGAKIELARGALYGACLAAFAFLAA